MSRAARYLVQMLAAAAAVVGTMAAANLAVDPLAWRPHSSFDLYSSNDRAVKARRVHVYRHDGLLMGSSKVKRIDPLSIPRPRLFNAAIDGAMPEEMLDFLVRHGGNERLVLLGLDFFMMKEQEGSADALNSARYQLPLIHGHRVREWLGYLCSWETVGLSVSAVGKAAMGMPGYFAPAGNQIFAAEETFMPRNPAQYATVLKRLADQQYHDFRYSLRSENAIKAIRTWATERNVRLLVFLNPLNVDEAMLLRSLPAWTLFLRFRSEMRQIFPDVVDLTEAYPDRSAYFPNDPFHYLPQTGTQIVREVLARHGRGDP